MQEPSAEGRSEATNDVVVPIRGAGIFGSTIAEMVFRAKGVDPLDHNRSELLDVMTATKEAFDALERQRRHRWHGDGQDSYANRMNRIVEYLRDGEMMSDLHEDDEACRLGVLMLWDDVLATLTKKSNASKPSRIGLMGQLDWYRLEQAVDHGERPGRPLSREVGIGLSSLQNLWRMYERAGRVGRKELNHS